MCRSKMLTFHFHFDYLLQPKFMPFRMISFPFFRPYRDASSLSMCVKSFFLLSLCLRKFKYFHFTRFLFIIICYQLS